MHPAVTKVSYVLSVFLLGISAAHAGGAHQTWTVMEASGTVHIKSAAGVDLGTRAGTRLHTPFKIVTGAKGRAVISHGQDRVTVGPDSRSTVAQPTPSKTGLVTRIKEMLGSVLYHVQHRAHGDFQVDTPYLVSVVKGTTFNIHVTPDASTVALVEGKLWVYTPNGKFQRMLTPGQAAIKSVHSSGIMLKDQQTLSRPVRGPITIVGDGDTTGPANRARVQQLGAASGMPANASAHASGTVPINSSLPNGIGSTAATMHVPPMVGDMGQITGSRGIGLGAGSAGAPFGAGGASPGGVGNALGANGSLGLSIARGLNAEVGVPGMSVGTTLGGSGVSAGGSAPGASVGRPVGGGEVDVGATVPAGSASSNGGGMASVHGNSPGGSNGSGVSHAINGVTSKVTSSVPKLGP